MQLILLIYSWYFGAITRKHAENLLMQSFNDSGSFLVRNSESTPGDYSLSIKFNNMVMHYKIMHDCKGYHVFDLPVFENVYELVEHYSKQPDGLCIGLRMTCLIARPRTASSSEETIEILEVDRASIELGKKLGAGRFGEVWQAVWNGTTEVAVKKLKQDTISIKEFLEEVSLTKQLRHPKLVQLYGVCTKAEPIYIITDLMKHGSLLTYLRGDGRSLKLPELIDMGAQVASGMAYLEEKNYVHRDLAARNILVYEKILRIVLISSEGSVVPLLGASSHMNRSAKLMEEGDISDKEAMKFLNKYIESEELCAKLVAYIGGRFAYLVQCIGLYEFHRIDDSSANVFELIKKDLFCLKRQKKYVAIEKTKPLST